MGTHPIFESDFDCLTEKTEIVIDKKSSEGSSPITGFAMNENDCKCNDPRIKSLFTMIQLCDWAKETDVDPDVLLMEPHDKMVMAYWWVVFVLGLLVNSTVIFMILSNRNLMVT